MKRRDLWAELVGASNFQGRASDMAWVCEVLGRAPAAPGVPIPGLRVGVTRIECLADGLYAPVEDGRRVLVMPLHEWGGNVLDALAIDPETGESWRRTGAVALAGVWTGVGEGRLEDARIALYRHPMPWLQAWCALMDRFRAEAPRRYRLIRAFPPWPRPGDQGLLVVAPDEIDWRAWPYSAPAAWRVIDDEPFATQLYKALRRPEKRHIPRVEVARRSPAIREAV